MSKLIDLKVPLGLRLPSYFNNAQEVNAWEDKVYRYFQEHAQLFTPYPTYFQVRCFEFRLVRQLLPELFDLSVLHDNVLEIGCGYGFKSLLLRPWARHVHGVDIPTKYKGYVRGDFDTSVDIARLVIQQKFEARDIDFEVAWPSKLEAGDDTYSMVVSDYVLEHIPELAPAIKEMARVLEPGGHMIHVVPNTRESSMKFMEAQLDLTLSDMIKLMARKVLGRPSGAKIGVNGVVMPQVHSEFISVYRDQLRIYSLESYLFPMLEAGLEIVKITSTREHNYVILARKPDCVE